MKNEQKMPACQWPEVASGDV